MNHMIHICRRTGPGGARQERPPALCARRTNSRPASASAGADRPRAARRERRDAGGAARITAIPRKGGNWPPAAVFRQFGRIAGNSTAREHRTARFRPSPVSTYPRNSASCRPAPPPSRRAPAAVPRPPARMRPPFQDRGGRGGSPAIRRTATGRKARPGGPGRFRDSLPGGLPAPHRAPPSRPAAPRRRPARRPLFSLDAPWPPSSPRRLVRAMNRSQCGRFARAGVRATEATRCGAFAGLPRIAVERRSGAGRRLHAAGGRPRASASPGARRAALPRARDGRPLPARRAIKFPPGGHLRPLPARASRTARPPALACQRRLRSRAGCGNGREPVLEHRLPAARCRYHRPAREPSTVDWEDSHG